MIQKDTTVTKLILKKIKPKAVLNTRNTRANNVMRFEVEFSCQSKDTGITTLCQSAQNHITTTLHYTTLHNYTTSFFIYCLSSAPQGQPRKTWTKNIHDG